MKKAMKEEGSKEKKKADESACLTGRQYQSVTRSGGRDAKERANGSWDGRVIGHPIDYDSSIKLFFFSFLIPRIF